MLAVTKFLQGYLAEALPCQSCSINTERGKALPKTDLAEESEETCQFCVACPWRLLVTVSL